MREADRAAKIRYALRSKFGESEVLPSLEKSNSVRSISGLLGEGGIAGKNYGSIERHSSSVCQLRMYSRTTVSPRTRLLKL